MTETELKEMAFKSAPCWTANEDLGPSVCGEGGKNDAICEVHYNIEKALRQVQRDTIIEFCEGENSKLAQYERLAYQKGWNEAIKKAAECCDPCGYTDCCHTECGITRKIRALKLGGGKE